MATRFINLSDAEITHLEHIRRTDKRATLRSRCNMILMSDLGFGIHDIAALERTTRQTVGKWFDRFETDGVEGLFTAKGQGRPPIVRFDNRALLDAIEAIVEEYPQKLSEAVVKIEALTGTAMSTQTLK